MLNMLHEVLTLPPAKGTVFLSLEKFVFVFPDGENTKNPLKNTPEI